jgi:hypothetical protein
MQFGLTRRAVLPLFLFYLAIAFLVNIVQALLKTKRARTTTIQIVNIVPSPNNIL